MISLILWYFIITIVGLLVFPLAYRLLPALSDRGYAISRILGILLWGYLFWMLGSLGILNNDIGGILIALLLVILMSGWALHHIGWVEIWNWVRQQSRFVITVEVLFALAFV